MQNVDFDSGERGRASPEWLVEISDYSVEDMLTAIRLMPAKVIS